jgi:hypothetical protein
MEREASAQQPLEGLVQKSAAMENNLADNVPALNKLLYFPWTLSSGSRFSFRGKAWASCN